MSGCNLKTCLFPFCKEDKILAMFPNLTRSFAILFLVFSNGSIDNGHCLYFEKFVKKEWHLDTHWFVFRICGFDYCVWRRMLWLTPRLLFELSTSLWSKDNTPLSFCVKLTGLQSLNDWDFQPSYNVHYFFLVLAAQFWLVFLF